MSTKRFRFDDTESATLANICRVAAERFSEHARAFRDPDAAFGQIEGSLIASPEVAGRLAKQFERQATEASEYASIFDVSEPFTVSYDEGEDEDVAENGALK